MAPKPLFPQLLAAPALASLLLLLPVGYAHAKNETTPTPAWLQVVLALVRPGGLLAIGGGGALILLAADQFIVGKRPDPHELNEKMDDVLKEVKKLDGKLSTLSTTVDDLKQSAKQV